MNTFISSHHSHNKSRAIARSPIVSMRINLRCQVLRIGYIHPENPSEDLCFEIHQGKCDVNILQDFLGAFFPKQCFNEITEIKAKRFCQDIYKTIIETWLKNSTDFLLERAANSLANGA